MKKNIVVTLVLSVVIHSASAGDLKVRASAQSKLDQVKSAATQPANVIQQLIASDAYKGQQGVEKYLAWVEKNLDRNFSAAADQLRGVSESSLRASIESLRKLAAEASDTALMNKADALLAPSDRSLRERLIQIEAKDAKAKWLASLRSQINQVGSVNKYLIQMREKILSRELEEDRYCGTNSGGSSNFFLFPIYRQMVTRNGGGFINRDIAAVFYAFLVVPVAIDIVLLPAALVAEFSHSV